MNPDHKIALSFAEIAGKVAQQIAINNAQTAGGVSLTV